MKCRSCRPSCPLQAPELVAWRQGIILARARAMRALGLPLQWAHGSVAWHVAARRDPLRYAGLGSY